MPLPTESGVTARSLLRDDALRLIRAAIVDGTLEPGERLRDVELERWLGISRTPIREALLRLEQAGLVRSTPGRSTVVSELDERRTREAQAVVAAMHRLATGEAAPLLTADNITAMREANTRFEAALRDGDPTAALEADDALHAIPVGVCANRVAADVLEQYSPLLRRVERIRFSSTAGHASVVLHNKMIDACESGDADEAARVAHLTWATLPLSDATDHEAERLVSAGHGLIHAN
jgi:DNA-binding GntR family transcriptional regulator